MHTARAGVRKRPQAPIERVRPDEQNYCVKGGVNVAPLFPPGMEEDVRSAEAHKNPNMPVRL